MFSTTQQVANALGVAVLGVIFAALVASGASYVQAAGVSFLVIAIVSMSLLWVVSLFPRTV